MSLQKLARELDETARQTAAMVEGITDALGRARRQEPQCRAAHEAGHRDDRDRPAGPGPHRAALPGHGPRRPPVRPAAAHRARFRLRGNLGQPRPRRTARPRPVGRRRAASRAAKSTCSRLPIRPPSPILIPPTKSLPRSRVSLPRRASAPRTGRPTATCSGAHSPHQGAPISAKLGWRERSYAKTKRAPPAPSSFVTNA